VTPEPRPQKTPVWACPRTSKKRIVPTPRQPNTSGIRSRRTTASRSRNNEKKNTHHGAVACSQMASAAVVRVSATRYKMFIEAKLIVSGRR